MPSTPRRGAFRPHGLPTPRERSILGRFWYPVARSGDIDVGVAHGAILLGEPLVIWRGPEGLTVAADRCPHRGAALSRGTVEGGSLVCPYHGWRFSSSGRCLSVPAHPDRPIPPSLQLRTYPCRERFGLIWTVLGAPAGDLPPLPEWKEWDLPGSTLLSPPPTDIEASAGRQLEGFIDVSHFAWVHHESFALRDRPVVPPYAVHREADGLRFRYDSEVPNVPRGSTLDVPDGFVWSRSFSVTPPYLARLVVRFPRQGSLCLLNAAQPVAFDRCRVFTLVIRDFDLQGDEAAALAFNQQIFREDQRIHASQSPPWLPLAEGAECHVPSDRASLLYRKMLGELGLRRG